MFNDSSCYNERSVPNYEFYVAQQCQKSVKFHRANLEELSHQRGMGLAKASQIKAAIELGLRIHTLAPEEKPAIHSSEDAANLVMYEMSALPQEHLRVINLDTRNRVINIEKLYVGSLNASTVRIGEIFCAAIQRNAAEVIILHNHPSGDPSPSPEDVALTRSIVQAGKLLDMEVTQMTQIGVSFHASIRLDTLPEEDLARALFASADGSG